MRGYILLLLLTGCATKPPPLTTCIVNNCPPPTPTCAGTKLSTSAGSCVVVAEHETCKYSVSETDCAASGQVCADGGCHAPNDPCVGSPCNAPPAASCLGDTLNFYDSSGTCDGTSGTAVCHYASEYKDCAAIGDVCSNKTCINQCSQVVCDSPPATACLGGTLSVYTTTGACDTSSGTPVCQYVPSTTNCAAANQACDVGSATCIDPCEGFVCATPPATSCNNTTLTTYAASGTCKAPAGVPGCSYVATAQDCSLTGQACTANACTGPYLFCRLQSPTSIQAAVGTPETVYGHFYIPGVTDQSTSDDPIGLNVLIEFGYAIGTDPTAFIYSVASPNLGYGPASPGYEANNDEYFATFDVPDASGTIEGYAFRLSNDTGRTWIYCDSGDAGSSDGFTQPGTLQIE